MTTEQGQGQDKSMHTSGVVSEYFAIEGHLISTRSADAYKAVDRTRNASVSLWMMRHPLALGSEAVKNFLDRCQELRKLQTSSTPIISFGVDAEGTAFCALPALDGHSLAAGNIEATEAERRFVSALRHVQKLHDAGITCGDLGGTSFWVDRTGDVQLIGLMGLLDIAAAQGAAMPPLDCMPFISPETRTGEDGGAAADVFALGVLGYCLLTNTYPYGEGQGLLTAEFSADQVKPISAFINVPPIWAPEVISKCLDPDPRMRYPNAGLIINAISEIRQRSFSQEQAPVVRGERGPALTGRPKQPQQQMTTSPAIRSVPQHEEEVAAAAPPSVKASKVKFYAALGLVGVFVVLGLFQMLRPTVEVQTAGGPKTLPDYEYIEDPGLKDAQDTIQSGESLDERIRGINEFRDSDDPAAHRTLVNFAKTSGGEDLRQHAETAIIDRSRRLGAMRSAEQVKQWLRSRPDPNSVGYAPILQVLDPSLPLEEKNGLLRQAYASDPSLILRLTAALALDLKDLEQYQPVMSELVGDALNLENADQYSALGLILAHMQLATIFADDIVQRRDSLTNKDILWVLKLLARRNDINTRAVANLALQRGVMSEIRSTFLEVVRDRNDLPPDVLTALIKAASGALEKDDLGAFGRWIDIEAEKILLAVLADTEDPEILNEAFDIAAGKSTVIQPAAALLDWVRTYHWEKRHKFAHVVGVFGFLEIVPSETVLEASKAFDPFIRDTDLKQLLLKTKHPQIVKLLISRYPNVLNDGEKLNLLKSKDKGVRLAAIASINTNNILALKLVSEAYRRETEDEVKVEYCKKFDFIRERYGDRCSSSE